jgi:hypothetical protein
MNNIITIEESDLVLIKEKAIQVFRSLRQSAFKDIKQTVDFVVSTNNSFKKVNKELTRDKIELILERAFVSILTGTDTPEYELFTNWLVEFQAQRDNLPLVCHPSQAARHYNGPVKPIGVETVILDPRLSTSTMINVIAWWLSSIKKINVDDTSVLASISNSLFAKNINRISTMGPSINEELQKTIDEDI